MNLLNFLKTEDINIESFERFLQISANALPEELLEEFKDVLYGDKKNLPMYLASENSLIRELAIKRVSAQR